MNVNLDLPPDLENKIRQEHPHLESEIREAFLLELFRQGRLSHFELSKALGLDRFETDALLKRRSIFEGSLTMEDLEADRRTLDRVLGRVP